MKRFGKREALRMVGPDSHPDTVERSVTTDGIGAASPWPHVPARRTCPSSYA